MRPPWLVKNASVAWSKTPVCRWASVANAAVEIGRGPGLDNIENPAVDARKRLHFPHARCGIRIIGVYQQADRNGAGNKLAQQIQALQQQLSADRSHARDVSARTTEAVDETQLDRIGAEPENDRNCRSRRLGGQRRPSRADRDDHGDATLNKVRRQHRQSIVLISRPAPFDRDIPTFNVAGVGQPAKNPGCLHRVPIRRRAAENPRRPASPAAAPAPRAAKPPRRRAPR